MIFCYNKAVPNLSSVIRHKMPRNSDFLVGGMKVTDECHVLWSLQKSTPLTDEIFYVLI